VDYTTYKAQYDKDGFVIVRRFLSSAELAEVTCELDRFRRDVVGELPDGQAFYHVLPDGTRGLRQVHRMNCDPFFEAYRSHPKWCELARVLVGEPATARPPMWFDKPPGTDHPTPAHQDNYVFCLVPPSATMILLATDPMDEENGGLRYVAGSHERGLRPHSFYGVRGFSQQIADFGPADEAREVPIALDPGDVVCHHPLTIHRARRNPSTTRSRRAFAMAFWGDSAVVDRAAAAEYDRLMRRALA
jgi:phytanoyl-CoA hydroxylase